MNVVLAAAGVSSECSSGCESGWTLYLEEHSSSNFSASGKKSGKHQKTATFEHQQRKKSGSFFYDDDEEEEDDEEDLSMVSDASSGPPHFDHDIDEEDEEEVNFCYGYSGSGKKKRSIKLSSSTHQQQRLIGLDDTASSPIFTPCKMIDEENKGCSSWKRIKDYTSQGFPAAATHFHQERSANGFIQSPFSTNNQFQHNQWS